MRISIIFLVLTFSLTAQNHVAIKEFEKIHSSFLSTATCAKVTVKGFKTSSDKKGFHIGSGEFKVLPGKGYYSSFDDEIVVSNSSRTLLIDKGGKAIGVAEKGINSTTKTSEQLEQLKSLLEVADTITLSINNDKGEHTISVLTKAASPFRTEIVYDSKLFSIKRIIYYYEQSDDADLEMEKMEVAYSYTSASALTASFFDTDKIVKKKGDGKYLASGEFFGYKTYSIK